MSLATDSYAPTTARAPAPERLPKPRLQWGAALKALRRLLADKDDTVQVFEIMRALNGRSSAWGYHRLLETQIGRASRRARV